MQAQNNGEDYDDTHLPLNCNLCQMSVSSRAKHCSRCNRCVQVFDHHCVWLNNCVGALNYKYFVALIVSVAVMGLEVLISGAVCFIVHNNYEMDDNQHKFYGETFEIYREIVFYVVVSVFMVFNLGALVFSVELILFHWKLRKLGMTTFEYLNQEKEEKTGTKYESKFIKQKEADTPDEQTNIHAIEIEIN